MTASNPFLARILALEAQLAAFRDELKELRADVAAADTETAYDYMADNDGWLEPDE